MTVQALRAGAVDFLTKPFRDQQIVDGFQQAIDRDRAARHQRADLTELRRRCASLTQRDRGAAPHHRAQLMRRMEAGFVAQLVRIAKGLSLLLPQR
jgi:FixJ family two-component response regulator